MTMTITILGYLLMLHFRRIGVECNSGSSTYPVGIHQLQSDYLTRIIMKSGDGESDVPLTGVCTSGIRVRHVCHIQDHAL